MFAFDSSARSEPRGHADVGPTAPIDAQSRQSQAVTMSCEPVHESVGRGVVGLTTAIKNRGHRREQYKQVQIQILGELVQVPAAGHFRGKTLLEVAFSEAGDDTI